MTANQREHWEPAEWDSAFFGVSTARLKGGRLSAAEMPDILRGLQAARVQVVHALIDGDHDESVMAAERAGFHLVDMRMTLEWRASGPLAVAPYERALVRQHHPADVQALQAIARTSYHHTRYYYDQRYPRERCDELYAEWIAKSCRGAAERVLVAERLGEPIGFVTCHLPASEPRGRIGLVGIRADARGLGVGSLLVRTAQRWFADQGARMVSVVTQSRNVEAQRLYQRAGFVTGMVQLWYHKWLSYGAEHND